MSDPGPAGGWDFALCTPGLELDAELSLLLSGTAAREVRGHPWLGFLKPGEAVLMRGPQEAGPPFGLPWLAGEA